MVARLVDAAIENLAEVGYAGTNARVVAQRAGVSQGAATHYFPSRVELIVAALKELTDRSEAEVRKQIPSLPSDPDERLLAMIDLLRTIFSGPLFVVWARLWFAAAEDTDLHAALRPLEQMKWDRLRAATIELLPELGSDPLLNERITVAFSIMRGYGLREHFDPSRDEHDLDSWPTHRAGIALLLTADRRQFDVEAEDGLRST